MNASALFSSRLAKLFSCVAAAGVLAVAPGCGGKSKSAQAQTPPPQSLSEPVRPSEETVVSPVVPPGPDDFTVQRVGETRALPPIVEPASAPRYDSAPSVAMPVPPAAPAFSAPPAGASGGFHTLQKGETLYAVSRMYNVKVKDLIAANNFKDPNKLAVGTKVLIPRG